MTSLLARNRPDHTFGAMRVPLRRTLTTLSLVFVMFFNVSGGAFTTESLIVSTGPGIGLLMLILVPLVWSLPETLIIGELASMLPEEGATTAGCIARSVRSGRFRTDGGHGCTRWSTWRFIQCSSINTSDFSFRASV